MCEVQQDEVCYRRLPARGSVGGSEWNGNAHICQAAVSSQLCGSCKLQIPLGLNYPSIVPLTFKKFDTFWVLKATLKIFTKSHPSVKLETYSDTN